MTPLAINLILGALFCGLLGVIIGSFLNVVILRYNTGRGLGGRSLCLSCTKPLSWLEMIPIVSFFALGRRCSGCRSLVSWQYPLVELATMLLFVMVYAMHIPLLLSAPDWTILFVAITRMFLMFAVWSFFVIIFVYDIYHKIIPNKLVYTLAGIAFGYRILITPFEQGLSVPMLLDLFAGFLFFIPFWLLWVVSRGRWIGLGDGKLALAIGWLLGFANGLSALVLAFWIGALVGIGLILISRLRKGSNVTMKAEIPFAPFLIAGTLIASMMPMDLFGINFLLTFL